MKVLRFYNIQQIFFFSDLSYPLLSYKQLNTFFNRHLQHCVFHISSDQGSIPILIPAKTFSEYVERLQNKLITNYTLLTEKCSSLYSQRILFPILYPNSLTLSHMKQEWRNECNTIYNNTIHYSSMYILIYEY